MTSTDVFEATRLPIMVNDLLRVNDLRGWKVSLYRPASHDYDPKEAIREFRAERLSLLEEHHGYHWTSRHFDYTVGMNLLGLAQLQRGGSRYLLTNVATVVARDDGGKKTNTHPYTFEPLETYAKWEGRVVVELDYASQASRLLASTVMHAARVHEIIAPDFEFDDDFPGYHNVDLSWRDLARVAAAQPPSWMTALRHQKGVYLITDSSNGKHYVGSAYGTEELWGRWRAYAKTGHGENTELAALPVDHIKEHFRYSLLETTSALVEDAEILSREAHWKRILASRIHGYNGN